MPEIEEVFVGLAKEFRKEVGWYWRGAKGTQKFLIIPLLIFI